MKQQLNKFIFVNMIFILLYLFNFFIYLKKTFSIYLSFFILNIICET